MCVRPARGCFDSNNDDDNNDADAATPLFVLLKESKRRPANFGHEFSTCWRCGLSVVVA